MKSIFVATLLTATSAHAGPPVQLTLSKQGSDHNILSVVNLEAKPIETVCFNARYKEGAVWRLYVSCEVTGLAAKASTKVTLCETCSADLPRLEQLEVQSVTFKGGKRWFVQRTAPAASAPIGLIATKMISWDEDRAPIYQVLNASKKKVSTFSGDMVDLHGKPSGFSEESHLDPGEQTYTSIRGTKAIIKNVTFSDDTDWRAP